MYRLLLILLLFPLYLSVAAQGDLPRHPSLDEVTGVLRAHLESPPDGFISYFYPDEANALRYLDVNGDGEADLLVTGWLFVAVLLWEGEGYGVPFQYIETALPDSGAWSNVRFQDFTLDESPEIVFELRRSDDLGVTSFERSLIRCSSLCRLIWQEPVARVFVMETGSYLYQTTMRSFRDESGQLWLDVISEDFAFNCRLSACRVSHEQPAPDSFYPASRVGATVRTRYRWDGLRFNYASNLVLVEAYPMLQDSQLAARIGDRSAEVTVDGLCQLWLDAEALGEMFPCLADFTRVWWRDVTGDGTAELLLEYAYQDRQWLLIYSDFGIEIARFSGAIRDADLFGIRVLEDGVLSAGERYTEDCEGDFCWYDLNQERIFYDWGEVIR